MDFRLLGFASVKQYISLSHLVYRKANTIYLRQDCGLKIMPSFIFLKILLMAPGLKTGYNQAGP